MAARRVALIGGAGFIGRALTDALDARGAESIVVDVASADPSLRIDIGAPDAVARITQAIRGVDAVVHLASRVNPASPAERAAMRALHIDGTRNVVAATREVGARLVLVSSATVYGAYPDNPVPLTEDHATRPNPGFQYGEDKRAQETIVRASGLPHAIARPAIVYGPGARNYLTEIIRRAPVLPALDNRRPPLQMVHVDDVASALAHLACGEHTGVFNVAPDDWLAFDAVARRTHKRVVPVPLLLTRGFDRLLPFLPPHLRAPRAMLPYLMHPFVMSNAALRRTGWTPRHDTAAALSTVVASP